MFALGIGVTLYVHVHLGRTLTREIDTLASSDRDIADRTPSAAVTRQPLAYLRAEVDETTLWLLVTTGIGVLCALGVAVLLTRILTQPVHELVDMARRVAGGDLSVRARQHADDEIGELAVSFNAMVDRLSVSRLGLVRQIRELGAMRTAAMLAAGGTDIDSGLRPVLEHIVAVMGVRGASAHLELEDGTTRLVAEVGAPASPIDVDAVREQLRHRRDWGDPAARVFLSHQDPPARREHPATSAGGDPPCCHLHVPLHGREATLGFLSIACRRSCDFTPEEATLLQTVGSQVGLAVEHARLWAEHDARQALRRRWLARTVNAQELERQRISRELHDHTGQLLAALSVGLETLSQCAELTAANIESVVALKKLTAQLLDDTHRLAVDLRPTALDQTGLVGSLAEYVREFSARTGVSAHFDAVDVPSRVRPEAALAVYRIVQEALTNVARHAQASRADVLIARRNGSLIAIVEDDGRGVDVRASSEDAARGLRLGLFGMRERAELVGGHLTIESAPGEGAAVHVEVPLDAPHDSSAAG